MAANDVAPALKRYWQKFGFDSWIVVDGNYPPPSDPTNRIPVTDPEHEHPPQDFSFWSDAEREAVTLPYIPHNLLFRLREALWTVALALEEMLAVITTHGRLDVEKISWERHVLYQDAYQTIRLCLTCVSPKRWIGESDPVDDWVRKVTGEPPRKWTTGLLCDLHTLHFQIEKLKSEKKTSPLDEAKLDELRCAFESRAQFLQHLPNVPFAPKGPPKPEAPAGAKRRGRKPKTYPHDEKIVNAWKTGKHRTKKDLANALGFGLDLITSAIQRDRDKRRRAVGKSGVVKRKN